MTYLVRALASTVRRAMRTFPAVLVTGPRQTGKTTLLREEFGASHRYVSLELPSVRDIVREDPTGFLADVGPRVILDEIQYTPSLLHHLKEAIDASREPGRWLLTSSQDFALMRGVSQTLAGRVAVLPLDPLSVSEVLGVSTPGDIGELLDGHLAGGGTLRFDLGDWLFRGAYPEPRLNPDVDRGLWMESYVQTYLERDLRNIEHVGDLETFRAFFSLTCAASGQVLNLTRLARDVGISAPTARRWLNVLVTSRLVHLLPPYHRNFGKRIRKSPKLHILDPGLAGWVLGYRTRAAIMQGPALGALAESAVVSELVKAAGHGGGRAQLFHWQDSSAEVDVVVEIDGRLYGIEVKATRTPTPRHAAHLARWCELSGARGILACRTERSHTLGHGIRAVPWHLGVVSDGGSGSS